MFKIKELSGQLIKSGRFVDAIKPFNQELRLALDNGVITIDELFDLNTRFAEVMFNPSNFKEVNLLGNQMVQVALRVKGLVEEVKKEEDEA
jgi:hypothetical protein